MTKRLIGTYLLAAAFSGTLGCTAIARAGWTRHAVTGCDSARASFTGILVGQRVLNNGSQRLAVHCAVPDTQERPAHALTGYNIFAFDGSTADRVVLAACAADPHSPAVTCFEQADGNPVSEVRHVTLSGNAQFWASRPGEFKFLSVTLPPPQQGRLSRMNGFTTTF